MSYTIDEDNNVSVESVEDFSDYLNEYQHNSQGLDLIYPIEVYEAYVTIHGIYSNDIDDLIADTEEAYYGEFDSDGEFAEDYAESMHGNVTAQEWPYTHIDWDAASSDLMLDYTEQDRYYFRNI